MDSSGNQSQVYQKEFNWEQTLPSVAVAYTIAALENTDVKAIPPLYEYLDPQSLDSLVTDSVEARISFTAYGYTIDLVDSTVVVKDS
ncbi:HalOD1 output domain-containing protein [Saliphagus infecundisoli]|uniref:HalOD1 output domain-containing protein n=1 Tax=Saliphagus infecundisoli TaxID=1849069 RepID=A0ABD5QLG9_9EURY|nr:HalOD1 output domain-containing protein [Saliphagus infecundisoli]